MKLFYDEVKKKKKKKTMTLRVDKEFLQVKITHLNDQNNVEILCGGKAFDAEQKVRELKTRISKLNAQN